MASRSEYAFFSNLKSLKHLELSANLWNKLADIAEHLPQLENLCLFSYFDYPKERIVYISKLKNLKMLKLYCIAKRFGRLFTDPMPNLSCLIIDFKKFSERLVDDYMDETWDSIATSFPNLKCLDIKCPSFTSDTVLTVLSRLSRLSQFRLHTQNPIEDSSLCPHAALLARQQVKSFCDQNQIEFLWSHFSKTGATYRTCNSFYKSENC